MNFIPLVHEVHTLITLKLYATISTVMLCAARIAHLYKLNCSRTELDIVTIMYQVSLLQN